MGTGTAMPESLLSGRNTTVLVALLTAIGVALISTGVLESYHSERVLTSCLIAANCSKQYNVHLFWLPNLVHDRCPAWVMLSPAMHASNHGCTSETVPACSL